MEEKSEIVYVETHDYNKKNDVVRDLSIHLGVHIAGAKVNQYYEDYSDFVYDKKNGNVLFFKTRYMGTWQSSPSITDYK